MQNLTEMPKRLQFTKKTVLTLTLNKTRFDAPTGSSRVCNESVNIHCE